MITNDYGDPGIWLEHRDKIIVLLPGPPRELEPMFIEKIMLFCRPAATWFRTLKVVGLGESSVEDKLAEIIAAQTNLYIAPLAKLGEAPV